MEQFEKKQDKGKKGTNRVKQLSENRVSVNKIKVEYKIDRGLKIIDLISIIFHQKVKLENLNLYCTMRKWLNIDILPLFLLQERIYV